MADLWYTVVGLYSIFSFFRKTHGSVIFKVNPPEERCAIAEFAIISSIQTVLSPGFI